MDRSPFFFGFFFQKIFKKIFQKIFLFAAARDSPPCSQDQKNFPKNILFAATKAIHHDPDLKNFPKKNILMA